MLHYILQTVIFQLLFLLIYDVFLKKETFFNWNRFYLLASALLSIVLPFIKIDSFKTVIPKEYIYVLPEIIIGKANNNITVEEAVIDNINTSSITFSWEYLLYLGSAIALFLFVVKFYRLVSMAYKNPKTKFENAFLIALENSKHAFSFFNYIFLGNDIKTEERQTILAHELQHVKEKHSLDLLFFEALKIIFWFNPLIYMYQKRIANLHEFIADSKAVKSSNKVNYYQNLLSQVFDTQKVSFINPFFKQSLIKKRIIMLSKSKSKQIHLVKYLLVFPMVIGMLLYTSCTNDEKINESVEASSNLTEEELVEKYKNEIILLKQENKFYDDGKDGYEKFLSSDNNNYLLTLDEYARSNAFMFMLFEGYMTSKDSLGEIEQLKSTQLRMEELQNRTYVDYIENKKTQESIDRWENSPRNGQLRKHVKDLDNITAEEQKLINSQAEQIHNDDFLHKQIISDGLRHKVIGFQNNLVNNQKPVKSDEMSFAVIDEVPVFPGCEASSLNSDKRKCFSDKINNLVTKNWNQDLANSLNLKGKVRIYVRFTINKEGDITNVKSRTPHPELDKEAKRIVKLIPKVKPGKHEGDFVNITFDLPITFNVKE